MANELSYSQVFVPGGYPNYTYNPRKTLDLESKIGSVLDNLCKLVVVTGHTKSGKTVLVQKMLPRDSAIWIDGGGIGSENDFWTTIIDQLKFYQLTETQKVKRSNSGVSGEISVGSDALVVKAETKVIGSLGGSEEISTTTSREVSSRVIALKALRFCKKPLVIDDFHYLPKQLQGDIVRALKPLIFDGLPVVFIAIPHRRYDAVKVEKEMTGRMFPVNIPLWDLTELEFIPKTGFNLLNTDISNDIIENLSKESFGSPHLMQEFCREICKIRLIDVPNEKLKILDEELKKAFAETAETIGRPIFEKLARGPRSRSDRKLRKLKDGGQVDIYGLILRGLSYIKPGLVTLEYEDLRAAIKEVCIPDDVPNIQEIARVLKYMSDIAATDQSSTPVIDFDEDSKILHITDPFFAFYLKWGNLKR